MNIGAINGVDRISSIYNNSTKSIKESTSNGDAFKSIFQSAMQTVRETSELQKAADKVTNDFVVGKTDNIHQVMIAQEKANLALQFTVEIRNKAIEAYKEIMRMQV